MASRTQHSATAASTPAKSIIALVIRRGAEDLWHRIKEKNLSLLPVEDSGTFARGIEIAAKNTSADSKRFDVVRIVRRPSRLSQLCNQVAQNITDVHACNAARKRLVCANFVKELTASFEEKGKPLGRIGQHQARLCRLTVLGSFTKRAVCCADFVHRIAETN